MEELNKKMCDFAGIVCVGKRDKFKRLDAYKYPDGCIYSHTPDFPTSLDACFEHIAPKLEETLGWQRYYMFLIQWVTDFTGPPSLANPPALAFCRAVEKLIDE